MRLGDRAARHPRLRLAIGVLLFALGLGFALARVAPLPELGALRIGAPWFMVDFQQVVYYPSRAFLEGMNPYDSERYLNHYPVAAPVSPYAPVTFLLFAPFGLLPLGLSSAAYFIFTVGLTLVLAWTALRLSGWPPALSSTLAIAGSLLLSRPGQWNLLLGQVTLFVVLGTYIALLFARRTPRLAGIGLALALLKPSFGVPLIPTLLARSGGRAVAWGLGLAAALNLPVLGVLVRREGGLGAFLTSLARSYHAFASMPGANPTQGVWRIDLTACISRLLNHPLGTTAELIATAVVLMPVIVMSRRLVEPESSAQKYLLDGLVCCGVLLSFYHQAYDLLLLALPAAALARTIYEGIPPRPIHVAQALLFAFLSLNYLATRSVLAAVKLTPGQRVVVISANGLALAALFGLYLVEARRLCSPVGVGQLQRGTGSAKLG